MARRNQRHDKPESEFAEKVVQISRVSKKTKGGNQISFSALMVVGDKKGRVGVALGKAPDVLSAIKKGIRKAKKELIRVPLKGGTIPFQFEVKYGAAKVLLKPAPSGSGIIAGGSVRSVVEAAGVTDIVGKILGSSNKASNVYATFKALQEIRTLVKVKDIDLTEPAKKVSRNETKKPAKATSKSTSSTKKSAAKKETKKTTKTKS